MTPAHIAHRNLVKDVTAKVIGAGVLYQRIWSNPVRNKYYRIKFYAVGGAGVEALAGLFGNDVMIMQDDGSGARSSITLYFPIIK